MLRCRASTVYKLTQLLHGEGLTHSNAIVLRFILRQMVLWKRSSGVRCDFSKPDRSISAAQSKHYHSFLSAIA
jgi:hypothetical protein